MLNLNKNYIKLRQSFASTIARILAKSFYISQLARLVVKLYDNDGNTHIRDNGELLLLKYLVKLSNNQSVVFDIGANIGDYSIELIQAGLRGKLILIDPLAKNLNIASKKINNIDYKDFKTIECAVSNTTGKQIFYTNTDESMSGHDSLYDMKKIGYSDKTISIEVQVKKLDEILLELNVSDVHFIKMDVEGNEFNVLSGAKNALDNGVIKFIQFEFGNASKSARVFLYDLVSLLESKQYKIYVVKPKGLLPLEYTPFTEMRYSMINFLAVEKNSVEKILPITILR